MTTEVEIRTRRDVVALLTAAANENAGRDRGLASALLSSLSREELERLCRAQAEAYLKLHTYFCPSADVRQILADYALRAEAVDGP